jgi:RNA polymerase sigma-70 factor (ECF subfamily)
MPPPSSALYDEWLVMSAQGGDRRAAELLFRRWNPRLARAARRYGIGDEAALDLAQECWVAILKGLGKLQEPARFRSYAFAVLHRRGSDHIRKTLKERDAVAQQSQENADTSQSDASDRAAITQGFARLPPEQRIAAHLYFVEGLTLREIAHAQSIPEGTAKSRIFNARKALKAALKPDP